MKLVLKLGLILPLMLFVVSCEEEIPDYAGDIINTYIVESVTFDGVEADFTILPLEDALFIKITRDEIELYYNSDDACDDDYEVETDEIDGVTETAILYMDGSSDDYTFSDGKLTIYDSGDIIVLAAYEDSFPPLAWTDPAFLTNDTYEPNNSITFATAIAAGGTIQNHYLAECGDQDYFVFSAVAGTSYFMGTSTSALSELDLTLTLYSGAGEMLGYNDDYSQGWNPGLDWTCPTTGDYYFMIEGLWEGEAGSYAVYVSVLSSLPKTIAVPVEKKQKTKSTNVVSQILFN